MGGPGSIPEFLKEKPKEEKKIEKEPVLRKEEIMGGPGTYPEPKEEMKKEWKEEPEPAVGTALPHRSLLSLSLSIFQPFSGKWSD